MPLNEKRQHFQHHKCVKKVIFAGFRQIQENFKNNCYCFTHFPMFRVIFAR